MADQKVRVDSGSPERVAFDLASQLAGWTSATDKEVYSRKGFLDLFAECLEAVHGRREVSE
jgi:hypothetical protein